MRGASEQMFLEPDECSKISLLNEVVDNQGPLKAKNHAFAFLTASIDYMKSYAFLVKIDKRRKEIYSVGCAETQQTSQQQNSDDQSHSLAPFYGQNLNLCIPPNFFAHRVDDELLPYT